MYALSKSHKGGPNPFLFQRPLSAWALPLRLLWVPIRSRIQGSLSPSWLYTSPPVPCFQLFTRCPGDCALFQHLGRQDCPVFKGEPGNGCGCYVCRILAIHDIPVPSLPNSVYHHPEITSPSAHLQLSGLVEGDQY